VIAGDAERPVSRAAIFQNVTHIAGIFVADWIMQIATTGLAERPLSRRCMMCWWLGDGRREHHFRRRDQHPESMPKEHEVEVLQRLADRQAAVFEPGLNSLPFAERCLGLSHQVTRSSKLVSVMFSRTPCRRVREGARRLLSIPIGLAERGCDRGRLSASRGSCQALQETLVVVDRTLRDAHVTAPGRLPALGRENPASHVTERHGACDTAVIGAFVMGLINQKAACGLPREGRDPVEAGINLDPSGAAAHIDRPADEAQGYAVLPALEGHQARGQRGDGPGRRRAPAALVRESSCPLTA
jgi:hypothetical protein